jgi:hypothetical protein
VQEAVVPKPGVVPHGRLGRIAESVQMGQGQHRSVESREMKMAYLFRAQRLS